MERLCQKLILEASARQKVEYYQSAYYHKRCAQVAWFLKRFAGRCRTLPSEDLFAEYKTQSVFDQMSVLKEFVRYDIVSFDIFDTLLFRSVKKPADVFRLLERDNHIARFAQQRELAERRARQKKYSSCGSYEVTLEEIYQMSELGYMRSQKTMIADEIAKEFECCYANPVMATLVTRLHMAGIRIIAVSDMYLTEPILERLLQNCGYSGIETVFVSSDHGVSKSNGQLFRIVKQKVGKNKTLLHIGDNFHSDVLMCEQMNLHALHYCFEKSRRNMSCE